MAINLDKPHQWKADTRQSVDMYNDWFVNFAPVAFRKTRIQTTLDVGATLKSTGNLTDIRPEILRRHPEVLPTLRMSTCPPLAVDRLIGLAGVSSNLVDTMEGKQSLPPRMAPAQMEADLRKIGALIERMADPDIFVWLGRTDPPTEVEIFRAATIVADRLCGAYTNPIIRNAQEERQLAYMKAWLETRGYREIPAGSRVRFDVMQPGTFSFRLTVPVNQTDQQGVVKQINIPVDAVIMPKTFELGQMPLLWEAKSAGDFANVNKRRKEEAIKMVQLQNTYGLEVRFNLFLCGYFDSAYLGYEAAEGIDWVWEHRIDDLAKFGI
jgi:hypothetical protein